MTVLEQGDDPAATERGEVDKSQPGPAEVTPPASYRGFVFGVCGPRGQA